MHHKAVDFFFIIVITSSVSLLILPERWLFQPQTVAWSALPLLIFVLVGKMLKKQVWIQFALVGMLFLSLFGYMHHQALSALSEAKKVAALSEKIHASFRIKEIHHQQDYQSVVIRVKLKEALPELRLYARLAFPEGVKLGEIWRGELKIRALSSRLNQGGFDRQKWSFAKRISGYASIKSAVKISEDLSWRENWFYQAKQQTAGLSHQGLLLALGFGERADLPPEEWKIYQQTNTAHLIAISGLHIGLAMFFGMLLGRVGQYCLPTRWISPYFPLICGVIFALFYAQLAGFAIPTFRAIVALLLLCWVRYQRYYFTPWRLFFLVISVLLISDPLMILSASFILSAGAVASLILWYQQFPLSEFVEWGNRRKSSTKALKWIVGLAHLQIGLFLFFMPIQLAIFGGFSFYGLFTNLLAVPFFSVILVPLVLFAILTQGALYSWLIADRLAEVVFQFLHLFSTGWGDLSYQTQGIFTALLALLLLWRLWRQQKAPQKPSKALYLLACSILCYGVFRCTMPFFHRHEWRVETLDVGQGLATLLVKNGRGILYDTGAGWQNGSMAELEIVPYLRRQGIMLDKLILSHDDNDHAGGAKVIFRAFPQAELISPSYKNYGKTDRTFCLEGLSFEWQGIDFQVLSPQILTQEAENADSCMIFVSDGKYHLLLTGDAEVANERKILPKLNKINVLQVGHHGSKTSTGAGFLAKIQPDIALISSGRWNPWRFPHKGVLERLSQQKSAVYNTAVSGQISVIMSPTEIQVETARNQWTPWYQQLILP